MRLCRSQTTTHRPHAMSDCLFESKHLCSACREMDRIEIAGNLGIAPSSVLRDLQRFSVRARFRVRRAFDTAALSTILRWRIAAREHRADLLPYRDTVLLISRREVVFLTELRKSRSIEEHLQ